MALLEGIGGVGGFGGSYGAILSSLTKILIWVTIGVLGIAIAIVIIAAIKRKRAYNIPLIILTPRSDGRVVEINYGKGGYFVSRKVGGITSFRVKRKGIKMCEIPPPASIFMSAPNRTMMLAQKGMDDYEPILPDSLNRVMLPTGEKVVILNLKAKNQDATAWGFDNAETSKKRFTLYSIWDKYQVLISLMLFIFIMGIVAYITFAGLKEVAKALTDVADGMRGYGGGVVTAGA